MVGAAIKGLSKILRKTGKKPVHRSKKYEEALKKRPRYRTDPKTGEKFLNRRRTVSGLSKDDPRIRVMGGVREALKGINKKIPVAIGAAAGAATAYGISKTDSFKKTAKKLKKAIDKHKEKGEKKKEKRKDNYGGR
tara:strand:- start:80 stop:487 length:408 start_codon:yes stop_codon:yes gene_type:complete